jgi:hypothetical protein
VLVPDSVQDSFIDTRDRLVVGRDNNGNIDIRVCYTIGAGNGVSSNKNENFYIYAYSLEPGYSGNYIASYITIPPDQTYIYVRGGCNGIWGWSVQYQTLNMYDGELRLYWDGSLVRGQWRSPGGSFSNSEGTAATPETVGNYFYVQILSDKNGSQVMIDDFDIFNGNIYYYSESPQITSIHKQELLEIKDVYPNNHKNVYVKTYVPKDLEIGPNYDVDMKVRWRIPAY